MSALIAYGAGVTGCRGVSSTKLDAGACTWISSHTRAPVNTVLPKSSVVLNTPSTTFSGGVSIEATMGTPPSSCAYGVTRNTYPLPLTSVPLLYRRPW